MNRTNQLRLESSIEEQLQQLYMFALERCEQSNTSFELTEAHQPEQQMDALKLIIEKLTQQKQCKDCVVYEKQLQKLEADIRQHIKLEHQFKLYQDSLEEKANENKRQWSGVEKEIDGYKRKIQQLRDIKSNHADQINKLQQENQHLKNEIKNLNMKRSIKHSQNQRQNRIERGGQSMQKRDMPKRIEARTMVIDRAPLTKTINFNSGQQRRSIDKARGITITEDMSKHRQSLNNKSSHLLKTGVGADRKKFQIVIRDKQNQKRKLNKIESRK